MGNNDYFSKKLRRVVDAKGVYHPATHGGPHFILGTGKPLGEVSASMTHGQVLDKLHQMGEWAESTSGTYGINEQGIPLSAVALISSDSPFDYTKGTVAETSVINHKAVIDAFTESGYYTQVIQYTITGSF